jgi:hypothetical protein
MSRLVSLNLCDNKLTDLPLSVGACVHMDSVILDRNPIKDQELLRKYAIGTDHLMDYLGKRLFGTFFPFVLEEGQSFFGNSFLSKNAVYSSEFPLK